jgi:hypothetical protein
VKQSDHQNETRAALTSPICVCRRGKRQPAPHVCGWIMCARVASRRVRDRDESDRCARLRWRLMNRKPFSVAAVAQMNFESFFFALSIYWAVKRICQGLGVDVD